MEYRIICILCMYIYSLYLGYVKNVVDMSDFCFLIVLESSSMYFYRQAIDFVRSQ